MSEGAADTKRSRVNVRRPDVMELVSAEVARHFHSSVVEKLRDRGGKITVGDTTLLLAGQFGFCYGVERAIDLWQQLVQRNPADEETQRALMAALASAGRRPEAIQRYQALAAFLRRELAVAPLPETTRLYQEILAGCAPPAGAGRPAPAALPRR